MQSRGQRQGVRELRASSHNLIASVSSEAGYIALCEFEEARAVALVERLATLHPDAALPTTVLAFIHTNRPENRYRDEGIKILRKAIANGVEDRFIYGNLSDALLRKGEYEESRQLNERSAQIGLKSGIPARPTDEYLGLMYYFKGEYTNADATFRRHSITVPMRDARTIYLFAETQVGLKRFNEAGRIFADGLARFPKNCELWERFGTMYVATGDVATALTTFDKGIAAVPKCGLNYNSAARLLIKQNRAPEARQKLETLIKLAPNSDGAVIAKEILAALASKP